MVRIAGGQVLARSFLVGILIAAGTLSLQAQMKLDPRLGAMRSVWIEAEDAFSDAPEVAMCFAKELTAAMPLTIAPQKNMSQVVFTFRPIQDRIEISVLLHDNQKLWSGTAPVLTSRTADSHAARCATARVLIEHLRSAMRSARDGIWYQPAADPAPEGQVSMQLLPSSATSPPERQETRFDILSVNYQVIEANRVFWRFSWKMSIRNYGPETVVVSPTIEFHNRGGFIVDTGISSMRTIRAQETAEITGTTLINTGIAPSVTQAVGRAKKIQ